MLTTNLLPRDEKSSIRSEENFRLVLILVVGFFLAFLVGSLLLLPSYLPFVFARKEFLRQLTVEEELTKQRNVSKIAADANNLKNRLGFLKSYLIKPARGSTLLRDFLGASAGGITISTLSVKKDGFVLIRGEARTRSDLLRLESLLRDSGKFDTISSPLSNIIREINVNFSIEGSLKPHVRL